ncbi:MAG: GNAT family N-acetyltransferase [Xanthobacteraceae bacterium]|nr:GNAT family N-acetyltransferase [Xanthobacteraceae bacterium]
MEWKRIRPGSTTRAESPDLSVEVREGEDWDALGWPSVAGDPTLEMTVFQSREFLATWMATIGRDRAVRPALAVVRDVATRPVLYLPFVVETRLGVSLLRFMDAGVADLNAPIMARGRHLTRPEFIAVWKKIRSLLPPLDVVDLRKMPDHLNGLRNPMTYLPCVSDHIYGHAVELSHLPEIQARAPVTRMRKKLRRQFQRLGELAPSRFVSNPQNDDAQRVIDGLFDLKRMQYLRTRGRDFLEVPGIRAFYRAMAARDRLGRISDLSALICGEEIAAAHLGFIGGDRFYYVMPAYDIRFRALAPGYQLLDHLLSHCRDAGFRIFDLGEGEHRYKAKFMTHQLRLRTCQRALTVAGMIYLQANRIRRRLDIRVPGFLSVDG